MTEINATYKYNHGRHEGIVLLNVTAISTVKAFAMQDGQLTGQLTDKTCIIT